LKATQNKLEITVVNTPANAIAATGVLEKWQQRPFENPYEMRERYFERESLESGLFGPVVFKKSIRS